MNIKVLEFERAAVHYKPYVESMQSLNAKADSHRQELLDLQSKAEAIAKQGQTIELTEEDKKINHSKMVELQQEAMMLDQKYKQELDSEQKEVMENVYNDIVTFINENFSDSDIVLNKTEVIYVSNEHNITDEVIEKFKEQDLFIDYKG